MLFLVSVTSQFTERSDDISTPDQPTGWRKLWQGLVDWLLEPIPFPGKCDINFSRPQSYNKEGSPVSTPVDLDGR